MGWPKGRPRGPLSPEHLSKTRRKPRPRLPLPPEIEEWMPYLNRAVKRRRRWTMMWRRHKPHKPSERWTYRNRNIDQAQLSELAAKMAVVGPNDPVAQEVYAVVVPLCLASQRLKSKTFKQMT